MLTESRSPKSPKSPRRFFVFPLPGSDLPDGDAVPPLPSMPSLAFPTFTQRGKSRHTPSSSIASSFSSSSVKTRPGSGSINNGFSGATVVRTPQEALEGIKSLTPIIDEETCNVTPRSAQPYRQPYGHCHSASLDQTSYATPRPDPRAAVHRSASAREELRTVPTNAPIRSGVVGIKGVLKSTSNGYLREQVNKEGWEREMLSPSLVSDLSLGEPLGSFLHSTSIHSSSERSVGNGGSEKDGEMGGSVERLTHPSPGPPQLGASLAKLGNGSFLSPRERSFPRSPPQHQSPTSAASPPTATPTAVSVADRSAPSTTKPLTLSSHARSPCTPLTSASTSPWPEHARTPSSPGPNLNINFDFSTIPIPPPPSAPDLGFGSGSGTGPASAPTSPPARKSSLPSNRHTAKPSPRTKTPVHTPPLPVVPLPPLPASTSTSSSPAPKASASSPTPRSALKSNSTFTPFSTSLPSPAPMPLPPTPFHATLLGQSVAPLPHGEEDVTLLRIEFAYSLDHPTKNEMLTLPLEVLRRAGESKFLSWVEGQISKLEMCEESNTSDTGRGAVQRSSSLRLRKDKKESVGLPDMTDGESAEESDLESDNGLTALLNDEYLKSLFIVEPDSPTLGRDEESPRDLAPPAATSSPSVSASGSGSAGGGGPLPDLSGITMNDQTKSRFKAKLQEMSLGLGFKRVPVQTRNQYLQILSKFPIASSASNQSHSQSQNQRSSTTIDPATISAPSPLNTNTLPLNVGVGVGTKRHPPKLELRKAPTSTPSSFDVLSPLPEVAEFQLRELRIFLTREAGVWHRLAHRLISGSWETDERSQLRDELLWAGMSDLANELNACTGGSVVKAQKGWMSPPPTSTFPGWNGDEVRHRDMRKQKSMVLKGGKGYI